MREKRMTVTNKRLVEILTTAMEKPEIANALIQRVINTLNRQGEREWQGLTDEECDEIWEECLGVFDCLKMTEAALKAKNA